ncbi:MAG: hypothetical protein ABR973_01145 [Candidatus Acidiferrales bacterium]
MSDQKKDSTRRTKFRRTVYGTDGKPRLVHVMADTDRALALKKSNPAAYRRLPKELREDAEEAERSIMRLPLLRFSIDHWPAEAKKLLAAVRWHPDSAWRHLPVPDVLEMIEILKKRGRPMKPETPARITLAAQCLAEGFSKGRTARRLYPNISARKAEKNAAYLFERYGREIEAERQRLKSAP